MGNYEYEAVVIQNFFTAIYQYLEPLLNMDTSDAEQLPYKIINQLIEASKLRYITVVFVLF
jgi:hypothetical protein